jgi:hypothetical protein
MNAKIFHIGVFPWMAIAATTLFLSPSWPRRLVALIRPNYQTRAVHSEVPHPGAKQYVTVALVLIYIAIQIVVPLRHLRYRGGLEWMYSEHAFSWRMMLQKYALTEYFYVTDPNIDRTYQVGPLDFIDEEQAMRMGWRPDMLVQFAHYLAAVMPRIGPKPLQVEVRMFISINGRKPQMLIDPNVDLAAEPRPLGRPRWLREIDGPLPDMGQEFSGDSESSL